MNDALFESQRPRTTVTQNDQFSLMVNAILAHVVSTNYSQYYILCFYAFRRRWTKCLYCLFP